MTNKLVVIIKHLKVPKSKKIFLYEMKFLVPNYSCLQSPWLGGYRPQIPVLSVLCPQLNLLNPPPRTKFLDTPLVRVVLLVECLLAGNQSTKKHSTYQLLYVYSIPPDDGLQIRPKHVKVDWRNKLRINSASSWFSLHGQCASRQTDWSCDNAMILVTA